MRAVSACCSRSSASISAGNASSSRRSRDDSRRGVADDTAGRGAAAGARAGLPCTGAATGGAPLLQPVAVAADVFAPAPVAFRDQRLRDDVVEEAPVVAHQQQRAAVALQRVLEELERLDVEVVGRLVEHQQVRGLREEPREQQAVALAARQRLDRRLRALRREQEVAEIA